MKNLDPWAGNWQERVYKRLLKVGFSSVILYAKSLPKHTFRELAAPLGEDVAPVQIEKLLLEEAIETNDFSYFARTCLIRYLRQNLPEGWGVGENLEFRRAYAFAAWSTAIGEEFINVADSVWNDLNKPGKVKNRWLPEDVDDVLIDAAFQRLDL
jgi:hypothetical protein